MDKPHKIRWDKENVVVVTLKLMRKTDTDIIDYLQSHETPDRSKQKILKQGMRLLMAQEGVNECSE